MFIAAAFPECLAFGAVSTPEWKTAVAENQGGWTQANQVWSQCKHSYDISTAVRSLADYQLVIEHFNEVRGRANTFPFLDPMDSRVDASRGVALYESPGVYQLGKRYGAINPYYRKLTRLVNPVVLRNGSPIAGVNVNTGRLTVAADQTRSITGHAVGAVHVFTLSTAFAPLPTVGSYVFASGVAGSASVVLNAVPLQVAAASGAGVTVAVNTGGMTASGGTLSIRPAPSEFTWAGEFRVPVRYGTDRLPGQIVNSNGHELFVQATSIILSEDRE